MKLDYDLLDFGEGFKLERFGSNTVMRPDAVAIGAPRTPRVQWQYQASCVKNVKNQHEWSIFEDLVQPWTIKYGSIQLELRVSSSKNIGVFPEQETNWEWLKETILGIGPGLKLLNLFAYTGAATLVCAKYGADVCHVDSAKSTVKWASNNAILSGLKDAPIRWIVDDAIAFLGKEARRGRFYDGIILDPPPMGHAGSGRFEFQKDAIVLLERCKSVLKAHPKLFLINAYAMNLRPERLKEIVEPIIGLPLESGELTIEEALQKRGLSCSTFARFR